MPTPIYCPICTQKLEIQETAGRKRPVCVNCGYIHYVNPVPTVGIVIELDGGVVLIKRANPPHKGEWAFPSGYVEADERLEEAAIREAEEETGLQVEIIELADVNSYPEGPPASGIMVFYRARPVGGQLKAGDDAVDARVFAPEEAPLLPFRTHREMMAQWLAARSQPHPDPGGDFDATRYRVRPAAPADFQQIIELVRTIPANRDLSDADWREAMQRLREQPALRVFVAQLNDRTEMIIGCVVLSVVRVLTGGYAIIDDMSVLPSFRRQGIGAALLEAAMRCANDLNLRTLMIHTPRTDVATRAFYHAAGFGDEATLILKLR